VADIDLIRVRSLAAEHLTHHPLTSQVRMTQAPFAQRCADVELALAAVAQVLRESSVPADGSEAILRGALELLYDDRHIDELAAVQMLNGRQLGG
jgi:hypothetical protein